MLPLWILVAGCVDPHLNATPDEQTLETVGDAPRHRPTGGPPVVDFPRPADDAPEVDEDPALSEFLWAEGSIHELGLTLTAADMVALEADPDTDVHATLAYGSERWDVGVQLKGNMTLRTFAGKPSLKIDVHEWRGDQRFYGLRRLTLNNMLQDKSMLKEHVAYHLYRTFGVPVPRHGYVRLTVNDQPYGLYGLVETMDQQFIDRHWEEDDEGNLYEGGYGADLHPGHASFEVQEVGVPLAPTDIEAIIDVLEESTPADILDVLETRFDVDVLLTTLAIDLLAGNWDAYTRAANNFLLYHAPDANRWHLVPWGQDQAFTDVNVPVHSGWEGRLLVLCGRGPACRARLYERVEAVLAEWTQADLHGYALTTAAAIAADCEADPRAEIPCSRDDVLGFLVDRPRKVREELDAPPEED